MKSASRSGAVNLVRRDRTLTRDALSHYVPGVFSEKKHALPPYLPPGELSLCSLSIPEGQWPSRCDEDGYAQSCPSLLPATLLKI